MKITVPSIRVSVSRGGANTTLSIGAIHMAELVTNIVNPLNGQILVYSNGTWINVNHTPPPHTHTKAEITDFTHTHTKADIIDFTHTHTKAQITDFAHVHTQADITDLVHDAAKIDGIPVDLYAIVDKQVLSYDQGTNKIVPGQGGGGGHDTILTFPGALQTIQHPFLMHNTLGSAQTITKVYLGCRVAPTGADIIVDIHKDGTSIFTDQTNRPRILAGQTTGYTTTIGTATWAENSYLQAFIDQVGSGTAGFDLVVHILHN